MFYFSAFPEGDALSHWVLYTGSAAILLILTTTVALIWSLWRARKVWWLSGLFLLLLGAGCWSLVVAFNGFQQLAAFSTRLLRPHSITPAFVHSVLGTAYGADVQRCQIQFGLVVAALILIAMIILRRPLRQFAPRDIRELEEIDEITNLP